MEMNNKSDELPTVLVIRGRSYAGKSYASRRLEKKFKGICVHYDVIVELVCECTRLFFEKRTKDKPLVSVRKPFQNDVDLENFRDETMKLISSQLGLFKKLYNDQVKNTLSRGELRKQGLDYQNFRAKLVHVAPAAKYLEKISSNILELVGKYLIKNKEFVIVEGVYFLDEQYLEDLKKFSNQLKILDCLCVPALGVESYNYENEKFYSLNNVEERIVSDFEKFKLDKNSLSI